MTIAADFVTNKTLAFARMRALLSEQGGGIQEGVFGLGDLKVTQRGAGANMSADVAIGAAWIQVDTGSRNGLSHAFSDAVANVPVSAAHATLPRIDQVVLQYNDSSIPAGVGGDVPTLRVLPGTPTSGATLANRTGAAALPNDCVRLADVLVPAAAASIVTANIRDRRTQALGVRASRVGATNDPSTAGTTPVKLAEMEINAEFSGAPVLIMFSGTAQHDTANQGVMTQCGFDSVSTGIVGDSARVITVSAAAQLQELAMILEGSPAAGFHNLAVYFNNAYGATGNAKFQFGRRSLIVVEQPGQTVQTTLDR